MGIIKKNIFLWLFISFIICGCTQNNNSKNFSGDQSNQPHSVPIPSIPIPSPSPLPSPSPSPPKSSPNQDKLLATAKTPIKDMRKNRLTNIALSIKPINAKIVAPGEIFSFNEVVGPRTKERGYKKAIIFEEGEKIMDYGGGVCQVSTTIYMAAVDAGLEIVERYGHQEDVDYAEKGTDATVSYGGVDLKIKNTNSKPINFIVTKGKKEIFVEIIQKAQ